jgi:tripartite-type tricarboxylate transporter receptor subunit TctC
VREQGLSEVTTSGWYGFMAPGATPQSIVDRMQAKVIRVLADTEVKQTPLVHGLEVNGGVAAEAGKFINEETRKWGGVIRAAGHERNKGDEE